MQIYKKQFLVARDMILNCPHTEYLFLVSAIFQNSTPKQHMQMGKEEGGKSYLYIIWQMTCAEKKAIPFA